MIAQTKIIHLAESGVSDLTKKPKATAMTVPKIMTNPAMKRVAFMNLFPKKVTNNPIQANTTEKINLLSSMKSQTIIVSKVGQACCD